MTKLNWLDWLTLILVIIGGLNWGFTALGWNLVDNVFGAGSTLATIIYLLVGLSALYVIFLARKLMKGTVTA
jgi:uncharacterized membrane protein YuzA (DUF378 family)